MSECVVRMEMPKDCSTCPFSTNCSFCEGYSDYCVFAPDGIECGWSFLDGEFPTERPSWCPILCQLPEWHGRLVDADAYSAEMKDRQDAAWKWRNEAIAEEDEVKLARAEGAFTAFVEAKLTWDKQATIVPADTAERSET